MKIIPETLKHWRKKRGFSQQKLAEEAGIDQKTVARIEIGKGGETRSDTAKRITDALRVKPETLAEAPDADARRDEEVRKKFGAGVFNRKLRLDGDDVIAYDLVQDRYGVGMYDLIKIAPLTFSLLAEKSLAERRCRLKAMEESKNDFSEHIRWMPDYETVLSTERGSLESRDLFGRHIALPSLGHDMQSWGSVESYFFEDARSPFLDFLIKQAESLGPDNEAIDPEEIENFGNFDDLPRFNLFEKYRKSLTGGSARADYALTRGKVRIGQIPKELRGEDEDVTSERVKWLESKVPDENWAEYEAEQIRIKKLLDEVSSKGGKEDV
ncbi:MAG: helix-turn-helix transcriptional regulator [Nitrospinae bacterium]|nr:helix-turn-helix transcriptional regulator [Nitrospinota bacterium]